VIFVVLLSASALALSADSVFEDSSWSNVCDKLSASKTSVRPVMVVSSSASSSTVISLAGRLLTSGALDNCHVSLCVSAGRYDAVVLQGNRAAQFVGQLSGAKGAVQSSRFDDRIKREPVCVQTSGVCLQLLVSKEANLHPIEPR